MSTVQRPPRIAAAAIQPAAKRSRSVRTPLLVAAVILAVLAPALSGRSEAVAIGGIHLYQRTLAPVLARAGLRCRFVPTCSRFGEVVIARDGVVRGGWEVLKRILRCGPWTTEGTIDEP
jgi:putative membrane protein insertion efficiency factor